MDQKTFEDAWHGKIVRPRGTYYQIPLVNYKVMAALYDWEPETSIFSICPMEENKIGWLTIHIYNKDLEKRLEDFEVINEPNS